MNALNPSSIPEPERRRRAVYAALLTIFPRADALGALAVWDRDYRNGRSAYDGLNVFARQVCAQFQQAGRHTELIQRLMQFFFAPDSALPPDPGKDDSITAQPAASAPVLVPSAAPAAVTAPPAAPVATTAARTTPDAGLLREAPAPAHVMTWLRIVQRLVAELAPLDRVGAASLSRAILQNATALGIDPVKRELLRLALEGRVNERLHRVTEADLRTLLNFAYVHAATAAGPLAADKVLSRAIAVVESMPEGERYSPRKLL